MQVEIIMILGLLLGSISCDKVLFSVELLYIMECVIDLFITELLELDLLQFVELLGSFLTTRIL